MEGQIEYNLREAPSAKEALSYLQGKEYTDPIVKVHSYGELVELAQGLDEFGELRTGPLKVRLEGAHLVKIPNFPMPIMNSKVVMFASSPAVLQSYHPNSRPFKVLAQVRVLSDTEFGKNLTDWNSTEMYSDVLFGTGVDLVHSNVFNRFKSNPLSQALIDTETLPFSMREPEKGEYHSDKTL